MRTRSLSAPTRPERARGLAPPARPRRAAAEAPPRPAGEGLSLDGMAERAARWGHRFEGDAPAAPAARASAAAPQPIQRMFGAFHPSAYGQGGGGDAERRRQARQRRIEALRARVPAPAPERPLALVPYVGGGALAPVPHQAPAEPARIAVAPEVLEAERHRFHQLLRGAHSDRGGTDAEFIRIHRQYQERMRELQAHPQPEPEAPREPLALMAPEPVAPVPRPLALPPPLPLAPVADRADPPPPRARDEIRIEPAHGADAPAHGRRDGAAAPLLPPAVHPPAPRGASLSSSVGEMLDRWSPSPAVTDPNLLQIPEAVFGPGGKLPSSVTASGQTQAAFGGAALGGTGMQLAGSIYTVGRSIHTLASGEAGPRERKAAAVDLGEGIVNTAGSGSSVAQSGINLAGSAVPHAASVAGTVLGGVSGFAGTGIGSWWLAKHGRRAVSSGRRYAALSGLESEVARRGRPALSVNDDEEALHVPLLSRARPLPTSPQAQAFLGYARRKNRNQTLRAGLGALSGGLGAAAGAAGIAALFGATAATPVGWGLAAAGAAVGLGLGAWKLGQWARRKYQTAKLGGQGSWGAFKSIFTRGKTRLQNEAFAHGMTAEQNPFGQAEHHARWLAGSVERGEEGSAEILRALNLDRPDFHRATPEEKVSRIKHRLRSSG